MDSQLDQRMWRQVKGAYTVGDSSSFRLIFVPSAEFPTMEEALGEAQGQICFLEPKGERCVSEIKEKDITLVIGNTEKSNIEFANPDETYRIKTPKKVDFYGINAAVIALDRWWSNQ